MKYSEFVEELRALQEIDKIPQGILIPNCSINNNLVETNTNIPNYQDYKYLIFDSIFEIVKIVSYDDTDLNNIKYYIDKNYNSSFSDNLFLMNETDFYISLSLFKSYKLACDILKQYININDQNKFNIIAKYSIYLNEYREIMERKQLLTEESMSGVNLKYSNDTLLFPLWLKNEIFSSNNIFISKLKEEREIENE